MWRDPDGWSERPLWNDPYASPQGYRYAVSFGGPYSRMARAGRPPDRHLGMSFSRTEVTQLFHSVIALTIAFGIAFARTDYGVDVGLLPYTIALALPAVLTGFFLHELGHKYLAQRYGCWSEFRAWYTGILMAVLLSPMVLFAAPGAVMISGALRRDDYGKISLMGPVTNMLIVAATVPAYLWLTASYFGEIVGMDPSPDLSAVGLVASAVFYMLWVNVGLALFNLIPFPPLDGSKVARWNVGIWLVAFASVYFVAQGLASI